MGNPHLVLFDVDAARAGELGPKLEAAAGFADRTNVEFARVAGDSLEVTVWERGVGVTLACGTGACATVAAAAAEERLAPGGWTRVRLPGGELHIRAAADLSSVSLRGPATYVFEALLPPV
jgi:diaminopimelate epimerase